MSNRKQSKKVFYPRGTETGKPALSFNLHITNSKEYKAMTLSQRILLLAFLEDCKNSIQTWIDETKNITQ